MRHGSSRGNKTIKKGKCPITPLQPLTLATFPSWGIQRELVAETCPTAKIQRPLWNEEVYMGYCCAGYAERGV